jgi:repressor LexA
MLLPAEQLTPRQLQLLRAIAGSWANLSYSPTIAELARSLNISRSTVFEHITELRKKSLLSARPGRARSLLLTSKAQKLLDALTARNFAPASKAAGNIPLLGRVAAGLPLEAVENKEFLTLDSCFGNSGSLFALEVKGNSMTGDGIHSGDYVICRRSAAAENGQLVVALIDDENVTLKRFYKEKDCVRLQPANNDYRPIYSDSCRIQALVIGLVRKL